MMRLLRVYIGSPGRGSPSLVDWLCVVTQCGHSPRRSLALRRNGATHGDSVLLTCCRPVSSLWRSDRGLLLPLCSAATLCAASERSATEHMSSTTSSICRFCGSPYDGEPVQPIRQALQGMSLSRWSLWWSHCFSPHAATAGMNRSFCVGSNAGRDLCACCRHWFKIENLVEKSPKVAVSLALDPESPGLICAGEPGPQVCP